MSIISPVTVYSNKIKTWNENVVELSETGVPPNLLDEVQELRSGACRGAGAAFRLVPAEIKHWPTCMCCTQAYLHVFYTGLPAFIIVESTQA